MEAEIKKIQKIEKKNNKNRKTSFGLSKKITILMLTFSVIMIISFGLLSYFEMKKIIMQSYGEKAGASASIVAYDLEPEKIKYYKKSLNMDDDYDSIVKNLDYMRNKLALTYLYVMAITDEKGGIYIYDTSILGDGVRDTSEYRQLLGDQTDQITDNFLAQKILKSGENTTEIEISYNDIWGSLATSYAPIKDKNGTVIALVGADIALEEIFTKIYKSTFKTMLLGALVVFFCILLILYIVTITIVKPINIIEKSTSEFVNQTNKNVEILPIVIENNDEIGKLSVSFNEMMFDIKNHIENIKKITIEKEQVAAELFVANQIQESMLPSIFPAFPKHQEFDIYAKMIPAKTVGGDFYDFFLIGEKKLAVVISDVSGKGISAALFMVIAKILINNEAHNNKEPNEILSKVNKQLCINNEAGMFATTFIGILSLDTGEFVFSNAGHTQPLIRRQKKEFEFLKINKHFILGGVPDTEYKNEKIYLEKGDILFFYTDGVTEAINSENEIFSNERLKKTFDNLEIDNMRLKTIFSKIKETVDNFAGGQAQADDITMMIVKFKDKN